MTRQPVTNAISFDVEHWHMATLLRDEVTDPEDHIRESLETVLALLERAGVRATFFIVGEVAAEYPDLVSQIADRRHEVASHGHTHTPLHRLTGAEFERELADSRAAIERATGVAPEGFRAPNFSVTDQTSWALEALADSEYRYDSSVFPVETPLYGVSGAPIEPYALRTAAPFTPADGDTDLVEFPLSVFGSRLRVPVAGGFYARVSPWSLLGPTLGHLAGADRPLNLYFHPWEFNPEVKTDAPPVHKRLVSFFGIERLEARLEDLMAEASFGTVGQVLADRHLIDPDGPALADRPAVGASGGGQA